MRLLTKGIRSQLATLHCSQDDPDATAVITFFTPWSGLYWFATERDGRDFFHGLVGGCDVKVGYFRLPESSSVLGPAGPRLADDRYYEPAPLSKLTGESS